jgi:hypothetical protein
MDGFLWGLMDEWVVFQEQYLPGFDYNKVVVISGNKY